MSDEESSEHVAVNYDPDDTIKILLATDCHLGYERTTRRDQDDDSLVTFEEILQLAQEHEVDFILLGGDLFHETKPPQDVMAKCVSLLKKYCMGTRDIKIQMLTDPELIFKDCDNKTINFEDPNLNISIPVFSIHGNHDDPSSGATGSLDLLSATGLVNYFGKWTDLQKVEIPPLIIKKGNTYISLYGLSYLNDKRLARLIRDGNFKMLRPTEIPESFNMFVLHQNRVCHAHVSSLNFIKEESLPSFLDFIMWGHEHECKITPEHKEIPNYYICQPGSSVATSLCEGETKIKHVGLLSVNKTDFKLKALKLKTVRPFVLGTVVVSRDLPELSKIQSRERCPDLIYKHVKDYIEFELMPQAVSLFTKHPKQPILPLIRVKVYLSNDDERFENNKISQQYCADVANPMDIVLFCKESRKLKMAKGTNADIAGKFFEFDDIYDEKQWNKSVQDGITKYFAEEDNVDKLTVFNVLELNEALDQFVDSDKTQVFENLIEEHKALFTEYLIKQDIDFDNENSILEKIKEFQNQRLENGDNEEFQELRREAKIRREEERRKIAEIVDDDNEDEVATSSSRSRGKARGRGRGVRGRAKAIQVIEEDVEVIEDDDDEEIETISSRRARGRSRARGRAESAATKRAPGRASKTSLQSFLSVSSSRRPIRTSTTSESVYAAVRDDDFIDSD